MGILVASDRVAGSVAHAAATLSQMALVALGVHLAADTVDDSLLEAMLTATTWADTHLTTSHAQAAETLGLAWDRLMWWKALPVAPLSAGAALVLELAADAVFISCLLYTSPSPRD